MDKARSDATSLASLTDDARTHDNRTQSLSDVSAIEPRRMSRRFALVLACSGVVLIALAGASWLVVGRALSDGPNYLTATHYWDDGNIRIDWKWRRTSAEENLPRAVYSLCIATAAIHNVSSSQPLTVTGITLELLDEHGILLHSEHEVLTWPSLQPGESREAVLNYRVRAGLAHDARALSARLGFNRTTNQ